MKRFFQWLLSGFFVAMGLAHFVFPAPFEAMIPPGLPLRGLAVMISGVAEIVFGVLLMVPRCSKYAAWGIIATLIAVYPANIYHAASGGLAHPDLPPSFASPAVAWIRLPFQFVFIAWAWTYTRPSVESADVD
jgi:uncharacterized membrane protein